MPQTIRYHFSQRFAVPAREAYQWCTNFTPEDHALMGEDNVERGMKRIADSTVILREVFHTGNGSVEKRKLVQLYPDRLSWISTHLSGPNKYSQFIYEISAEGNNASRLNFTALHLEYEKGSVTRADAKLLAEKLCKYDSKVWKLLAEAMEREFTK